MIYNRIAAQMAMGMVMNNVSILYNSRFKLTHEDFKPILWHFYLFSAIEIIAESGCEEIDANTITAFLLSSDKYKSMLEVLKDNDYVDFVTAIKGAVQDGNQGFEYYYDQVKKYSLVRNYKTLGFNVDSIYDEAQDEAEQKQRLNSMTIDEILNHFELIQTKMKAEYSRETPIEESWVGENVHELLQVFKQTPATGCVLNSPYLSTISAGWQRGHLILRTMPSGTGKTAQAIGDLCLVCCKKIWDVKKNKYVDNPQYQGKGFYIHTEQKQWEEIVPRFLSYISNVECYRIMRGQLTEYEEQKVEEAGAILKDSGIRLINLPQFTMGSIRNTIKNMVLQYGCTYGVFDYIFDNTCCMQEYRQKVGNSGRQDMMFLAVATELKEMAEEYNIGLMSMTQTNGKEKQIGNGAADESCVFGSTQMKNKLDTGVVSLFPKKSELELIAPMIENSPFGDKMNINMITSVYKGRYNMYGQTIKIWQHLDRNTGRLTDYFCTDADNEPIQVDRTVLEGVELI
jgi:replicative DNA helicase